MKIEFESILFGAAFLILVLISLPKEDQEKPAPIETASAEAIAAPAALPR